MGEADWWLCVECQSLNNFSARKCYSCRKRKPKNTVRASEYLGYEPVKSWDGKVEMRTILPPAPPQGVAAAKLAIPPLRDPVRRDTLAIAPRPPEGARIVYRDPPALPPPPPPSPLQPSPLQPPLAMPPVAASPLDRLNLIAPAPNPSAPTPGPRPLVGVGPAPPPPAPTPDVAVTYVVQHDAEQRSHWQDLLDVPTPKAHRLRAAQDQASPAQASPAADHRAAWTTRQHDSLALHHAMKGFRPGTTRAPDSAMAWPEADLAQATELVQAQRAESASRLPWEGPPLGASPELAGEGKG